MALLAPLAFGVALLTSCGTKVAEPPPTMTVEDASGQLEDAAKAATSAQVQAQLNDAAAAFHAKNYPLALMILQSLSGRGDLTPDQQRSVAGVLLAVNKALAEQANAGNAQAQQAVQRYRATK